MNPLLNYMNPLLDPTILPLTHPRRFDKSALNFNNSALNFNKSALKLKLIFDPDSSKIQCKGRLQKKKTVKRMTSSKKVGGGQV